MENLKCCSLILYFLILLMDSLKPTAGQQNILKSHISDLDGSEIFHLRQIGLHQLPAIDKPLEQIGKEDLEENLKQLALFLATTTPTSPPTTPTSPTTTPTSPTTTPTPQQSDISEKQATICEWDDPPTLTGRLNTINLKCQNGGIKIKSVFYGREDRHTCVPSGVDTSNFNISCSSDTALSYVKDQCEFTHSCTLEATNKNFGDPCPGTWKYLTVAYYCQGMQHYQFNEHGEIECDTNEECPGTSTDPGCEFIEDDGRKIYHCWQYRNTSYCGNISSQKTSKHKTICLDILSGEKATNCYIDPVTKKKHTRCGFSCIVDTHFSSSSFKEQTRCKAGGRKLTHASAVGGQEWFRSGNPNRPCPHGSCRRGSKCCRVVPYRRSFFCPHYC